MRSVLGNACRAIAPVRIPGYALKKKRRIEKSITFLCFFCQGHQGALWNALPSDIRLRSAAVAFKLALNRINCNL